MQNEEETKKKVEAAIRKRLENKFELLKPRIEAGEVIPESEKIQVAVLADSPTVVTGFGNVCREVLTNLHATGYFAFEIVGINYDGSPHDLPFKIYPAINALVASPAYREPYGRQRFLDLVGEGRFDIVWVLQDSFIVGEELGQAIYETNDALPAGHQFASIFYFPIDATPKKDWIDKSAFLFDFPVVYTQYGYDEVLKLYSVDENSLLSEDDQKKAVEDGDNLKKRLSVIYHGVNTKDFHPIEDKEKVRDLRIKWFTEKNADKFIFINVNRNQPRKDLYRTLEAFKILLDRRRAKGKDDVYLYLHCNIFDNGMNLIDMSKQLNLVQGDEWAFPDPKMFAPSAGLPIEKLNELYNCADAVVSTTLGEGWGLSLTEAMATKRPIIGPDHTSLTEILGRTDAGTGERGFLVQTKGTFVQHNDNGRVRPITDPEDLADKMEMVMENREAIQPIVDSAFEWVNRLAWGGEEIMGKWKIVFETAFKACIARRASFMDKMVAQAMKDKGRNDICPTCHIKVKKCRHGQALGI